MDWERSRGWGRSRQPEPRRWRSAHPALSPALVRAGSMLPTSTLRLDVHPANLRHPRHMLALERALARSGSRRTAVTYRELAGVPPVTTGRAAPSLTLCAP